MVLGEHDFSKGTGLYTDMDAIRKDEIPDSTHSLYVDQWDWERVISKEERSLMFLKKIVRHIYSCIYDTKKYLLKKYPSLKHSLEKDVYFIHSEDLQKLYPSLSSKEREDRICKEHGTVFIIGIGFPLDDGKAHDLRATDYDDWSTEIKVKHKTYHGLNGDLLVYDPIYKKALELSSMGIRVSKEALLFQLREKKEMYKLKLDYHKRIVREELPLSIGGGIGQSRLCMFLLEKGHIGEVQSSVWPEEVFKEAKRRGIPLL